MTPAGFVARSRVPRASAVLSRFACLRRAQRGWILESPLSTVRIELLDPAGVRLIGALGLRGSAAHRAREAGISPGTVRAVLALLDTAGFLTTAEASDPSLAQWEFADLLLHARSRLGTHDQPIGARFGFRHRIAPLPALKRSTPAHAEAIPLPRPDPERLARTDQPFAAVLEGRRSTRNFSGPPLSVDELGEIHWRSISSPGAASGSRPVSIITIPPGTRWPRFPGHRLPPGASWPMRSARSGDDERPRRS